jgi:hypothetical protein
MLVDTWTGTTCPVYRRLSCSLFGGSCPSGYVRDSSRSCCCGDVFGACFCPGTSVNCRKDVCCAGWTGPGCNTRSSNQPLPSLTHMCSYLLQLQVRNLRSAQRLLLQHWLLWRRCVAADCVMCLTSCQPATSASPPVAATSTTDSARCLASATACRAGRARRATRPSAPQAASLARARHQARATAMRDTRVLCATHLCAPRHACVGRARRPTRARATRAGLEPHATWR